MTTLHDFQKKYLPGIAPEDFFVLLAHATGKERVFLLAHPEHELSEEIEKKAGEYLKRRLKHEPVAYITGHKEFYGRDFRVTQDTLIPRPETELLVEATLHKIKSNELGILNEEERIDIVDIGTGSGNIIITLAKEFSLLIHHVSYINFYGLDTSPQALVIAKENAKRHSVEDNVVFMQSDLLQNFLLPQEKNRHVVITANLPYLSSEIYQASSRDVRDYEPQSALESGADGLDHYRALFRSLPPFSKRYLSTTFFLEMSPEQSSSLLALISQAFPEATVRLFRDLAGKDRLIQATL